MRAVRHGRSVLAGMLFLSALVEAVLFVTSDRAAVAEIGAARPTAALRAGLYLWALIVILRKPGRSSDT